MNKIIGLLLLLISAVQLMAQSNPALNMSVVLAYNARFNPADTRQDEIIKTLKPTYLITHLKTDKDKNTFWINVYNSYMLTFLRDTIYEGVYTNFYKKKNVTIAGKAFSLFEIEHEFLLGGSKMKALKFKKSKISKDTTWVKLRPAVIDGRVLFCLYRGLFGYPPYQIVEGGDINQAYLNIRNYVIKDEGTTKIIYDWVKPYSKFVVLDGQPMESNTNIQFVYTPLAVQIKNFYPKYEGIKFEEEEKNPWLK